MPYSASVNTDSINISFIKYFFYSLLIFFILFALTPARLNNYDEGLIVVATTRIMEGYFPHRDFYVNYAPLQFLLLSLPFKVFGANLIVHRALDALIKTACVILIFLVCRRMSSRAAALLAALLSLIWLAVLGAPGYPIWLSIALALFVVWLLDHDGAWVLFSAGVVSGLAFAARYDLGAATVVVVTTLLFWRAWTEREAHRGFIKSAISLVGPYLLGATLVISGIIGFYYVNGALADLYFQVIEFGATKYPSYRRLPFPGLHSGLIDISVYLPVITLFVFGLALMLQKNIRDNVPRTLLLVVGLCAAFYFKGIVRVSAVHMGGSIILSFVILATVLDSVAHNWKITRAALRLTIVVTCAVFAIFTLRELADAVTRSVAWSAFREAVLHRTDAGARRVSGVFLVDEDEFKAAEYIKNNSDDHAHIFVGAGRHDKLFINDVLFYFLTQRDPLTKWYHFDPGLQTSLEIQNVIVADLVKNRPEYVVITTKFDDMAEPNLSATSSGVKVIDDYIGANCSQKWASGTYKILACP